MKFWLSLVTIVSVLSTSALGDTRLDSLLDRLERKLTEQGKDGIFEPVQTRKDSVTYKSQSEVSVQVPWKSEMNQIEAEVAQVTNSVKALSARVNELHSSAQRKASLMNLVDISAEIENMDMAGLVFLNVKLNSIEIVNMEANSGVWLPGSELKIFEGPLTPNDYVLELDARYVDRSGDALPLNKEKFFTVKKIHRFSVDEAKGRYSWELKLRRDNTGSFQSSFERKG